MEDKFYVYVYLDPRKNGSFIYGDYNFNFEPFYVGKGHGNRCNEHLESNKLKNDCFKNRKIKNILKEGSKPIILKISENLFEIDSFELEVKLINVIGRSNLKKGPLVNLTNGGDGVSGLIRTKQHSEKLKIANSGKKRTFETKEKIKLSLIGKIGRNTGNKHSEKTKLKISESKKGNVSWNAKSILQLDDNNNVINIWRSASDAAKKLGLSQGNIWSVINGKRKKCGGYKWQIK